MVKIAINGFGRIGKQFFLACIEQGVKWDFVINEPGSLEAISYSLKHDSVHKMPDVEIKYTDTHLFYGTKKIRVYSELNPEKLPWEKEKIDLVVECTGAFTSREGASKHLKAGAKKVLISAPAKDHDLTLVYGVNDSALKPNHKIISAGSCTTNCISPMMKVLDDALGIESAYFITSHAYTATQKLIDAHDKKDFLRGRAAAANIIPSTSGASISVVESLPQLKGKLDGYALRVPVIDGSISSVIARVKKKTNAAQVNLLFKKASSEILKYSIDPLVSSDIIHNSASCIFDSSITSVNGDLVSIAGWYDNEWGYSNRLVDVAKLLVKK